MFDAGSVSVAFTGILNSRIPSSRKVSAPYTNTMVAISKIWLDSMSAPMAAPMVKYKNGETFYYACHGIICHVGGAISKGTKQLKAVSKGCTYKYGIESKIKVVKNQLPNPWTISYEGPIICTAHGLISKDELPAYQKEHVSEMLKELNRQGEAQGQKISSEDVSFIEEEDGNQES